MLPGKPAPVLYKQADDTARYRLFGFLLGSTLAGASVYYYILEEYKVSNEMLTEDIYVCPPILHADLQENVGASPGGRLNFHHKSY